MSRKTYGVKQIIADSACPSCRAKGGDKSGNHLMFWRNTETLEEWVSCTRCGHYEVVNEGNRESFRQTMKKTKEWSPEELKEVLDEHSLCPFMEMKERSITKATAERFGARVGLSPEDGSTPHAYLFPKTKDGRLSAYQIKTLQFKAFYAVGDGSGCDLFGIGQSRAGDVYTGKLFIFEDQLSAMSGYQVLVEHSKTAYKPACVALPDGAKSATTALSRNRDFIDTFKEIVVCMDNDEAGEEAVSRIRSLLPHILVARIPKGVRKNNKDIKDANDMLMEGRGLELYNLLKFNAAKESPTGASTVSECLQDALRKPEMGLSYPWPLLTEMTYGLRYGEVISIGAGVSVGKTLIGHELISHLILEHKEKVGVFMLEETVGNTLKNVAGKSANVPFHRPDIDYDTEFLTREILKYDGQLFLYNNFGQNMWADIKNVMRFWVVEHGVKFILLDNITQLVSHLSATEINAEVSKIAVELAGLCNELNFTCFVFSHLNPPKTGAPHELG